MNVKGKGFDLLIKFSSCQCESVPKSSEMNWIPAAEVDEMQVDESSLH